MKSMRVPCSASHRGLDAHDIRAVSKLSHAEAARSRQRVQALEVLAVMLLRAQLGDGACTGSARMRLSNKLPGALTA